MDLHNEKSNLQIELTRLQIKHQYYATILGGIFLGCFAAFVGFMILVLTLLAQPGINIIFATGGYLFGIIVLICMFVGGYYFTSFYRDVDKQIDEIKKRYFW